MKIENTFINLFRGFIIGVALSVIFYMVVYNNLNHKKNKIYASSWIKESERFKVIDIMNIDKEAKIIFYLIRDIKTGKEYIYSTGHLQHIGWQ